MDTNDVEQEEVIPALDGTRCYYSPRYCDSSYEYRHVILPKEFARFIPRTHLLTETEWRNLGIQQSPGWEHYMVHKPEPHVLMFRRPLSSTNDSENALGELQCVENDMSIDSLDEKGQGKKYCECKQEKYGSGTTDLFCPDVENKFPKDSVD